MLLLLARFPLQLIGTGPRDWVACAASGNLASKTFLQQTLNAGQILLFLILTVRHVMATIVALVGLVQYARNLPGPERGADANPGAIFRSYECSPGNSLRAKRYS